MKLSKLLIVLTVSLLLILNVFTEEAKGISPSRVAIFGKNRTAKRSYNKYVEMLKSGLVSSLSEEFTIIDKGDVIKVFKQEIKRQKKPQRPTFDSFLEVFLHRLEGTPKEKEENIDNKKTIEQKSSALRISQLLAARYILIANLDEVVINNIRDEVYGNKINDLVLTADISAKILDGRRGGSIVSKVVRVTKRIPGDEKTIFTQSDVTQNLPVLVNQAAKDVGKYFLDNIEKIKAFQIGTDAPVNFRIDCNIDKVTVELDGAVIGSAPGNFKAVPGIHRIRLTKDGYRAFERDINVFSGSSINVSLEMTEEGIRKDGTKKLIDAEIKKKEAEAYSIKKSADAEYKWGPKKAKEEDW